MIQNPKNLTEQLMNLCEILAINMRAIYNKCLTKLDASKWDELKGMAFKDSVPPTSLDKFKPDPIEFFNEKYGDGK